MAKKENVMENRESITWDKFNEIKKWEQKYPKKKIFSKNNKAYIIGTIEKEFELYYSLNSEKFYRTRVIVSRHSGKDDLVPIVVSENLIGDLLKETAKGKYVEVAGQFCSIDVFDEAGCKHLNLYLFAKVVNIVDGESEFSNNNLIYLEGELSRKPVYRTTPAGRLITDLFILVQRDNGKIVYLPCIVWDRNAQIASKLNSRDRVKIYGRINSRSYKKFSKHSSDGEIKDAYEISINLIEKV